MKETEYQYPFTELTMEDQLVIDVFMKATPVKIGAGLAAYHDICGHPIQLSHHGDTDSDLGWEIDHIVPLSQGGSDDISNLQPLFWRSNREKGDQSQEEWNCGAD